MTPRPSLVPVVEDLTFPTSLAFDDAGRAYVAEAGLPFGGAPAGGRVWRIERSGARICLAEGLRAPVNGVTWHDGVLYVAEGGHPPRIVRLDPAGAGPSTPEPLLDGLPGPGNYHLNMPVVGPDARLYFSVGAMTNSGIVGLDAYEVGWLGRLPHAHDVPGYDVVLRGVSVSTPNPLAGDGGTAVTSAFAPFGTVLPPGHEIAGRVPCTAAVLRCGLDGGDLELVAWGLRNAYGLGFLPDGRLLAVDQGADDRGSRPIGNAPDLLHEVRPGAWYGWPDFIGAVPVTDARFAPERGPAPDFLLANHATLPPPEAPLLAFPPHTAAVKFDVAPPASAAAGDLFVALFGDERPMTAPAGPRVGRSVVRVDTEAWSFHQVVAAPLLRPIDVRFSPLDGALSVVDFGAFEMAERGVVATPRTGKIWRLQEDGE